LHLYQKLMFGPITQPKNAALADLNLRETLVFAPIVLLIIAMGLYPKPFLERIDPTSQAAVADFNLRRCASIWHANGERPVLLSSLVDKCAEPLAIISRTYGDQRPAFAFSEAPALPGIAPPTVPPPAAAPPPPEKDDAKADGKAPRRPVNTPRNPRAAEGKRPDDGKAPAERKAGLRLPADRKAGAAKAGDDKAGGGR
jgi:hypothetical protein